MRKSSINIIFSLFSILAMTGMFTLVKAVPASAAYSDCPSGVMCTWDGSGGTGTRWQFAYSVFGPVGTCRNLSVSQGDDAWNSYYNRYGSSIQVYTYLGWGCATVLDHFINGATGNVNAPNNISSFKMLN